jgi:molybdopterin-guanine dinucleotide biosynthesis protein A
MRVGLLLLTGGQGTRMGAPKQDLRHPSGVSWGALLVRVFRSVHPDGPVQLLGAPLAEDPGLPVMDDPRRGPALALVRWAGAPAPAVDAWWVVACDQVRWTEEDLRSWVARAEAADPGHARWVLGRADGQLQPLGGLLPHGLRPRLAQSRARSLRGLVDSLPHRVLDSDLPGWRDVDTREARRALEEENG